MQSEADVARSSAVDHAGQPSGSRVPLRTPIGENAANVRGEHPADGHVQLHAPRFPAGSRAFARSRLDGTPNLAEAARSRSHFSLVANQRRGSVNRSPQGAIRGGFAVSPQNSERFARCASCDGALASARRERRASAMSAAWESFPALSPVPWGERSREAFNCVPGDQQSAPLINSFGVRDGAEPVDHRGDGSCGATNDARPRAWRAGRERSRPSSGGGGHACLSSLGPAVRWTMSPPFCITLPRSAHEVARPRRHNRRLGGGRPQQNPGRCARARSNRASPTRADRRCPA